jgi:hypothetical protein
MNFLEEDAVVAYILAYPNLLAYDEEIVASRATCTRT